MKLASDWRSIIRRAWSVRFMALAAILSGIEAALPLLDGVVQARGLFAAASAVVVSAAFVARILAQNNLGDENAENK